MIKSLDSKCGNKKTAGDRSEWPTNEEYIKSLEKKIEELITKKKATQMAQESTSLDTPSPSSSHPILLEEEVGGGSGKRA